MLDIVAVVPFGVTVPHASVAVAVPSAASIDAADGLQPRDNVVPVAVITGTVTSCVQEIVLETESAVLPHASVAVQILV